MSEMHKMSLLFGGMWLICAIACLAGAGRSKGSNSQKKTGIGIGIFFAVAGSIAIAGYVLHQFFLECTGTLLAAALLIMGTFFALLKKRRKCSTPVWAEYIKWNEYYGGRGGYTYAPVFRYTYEGKEYEQQSPVGYSQRRLEKRYQAGQKYKILIDEKCPECCMADEPLPIGTYILPLMGIGFLIAYILVLMMNI